MTDESALRSLDHLVIAVHDLDRSIADYRSMGFTVNPGGRHPGRSSHNALIVFADGAYIELISWQAPAPEERWWRVLQTRGEGFVDFALLPGDTAAAIDAARSRGLTTIIGPVEGGRVRPDGMALQWRTARQASHDLPFLCGDVTARNLRVPEGEARQHPNGVSGVAGLSIAVRDLGVSVKRYSALLGPAVPVAITSGDPQSAQASFLLGSTQFTLVTTTQDEGPSHMTLIGPVGVLGRSLSIATSHGAAIDIS